MAVPFCQTIFIIWHVYHIPPTVCYTVYFKVCFLVGSSDSRKIKETESKILLLCSLPTLQVCI